MRPFPKTAIRKVHPPAWLWEPMEEDATFFLRSMFGSKAVYLDGKVMLYFSSKGEPLLSGRLIAVMEYLGITGGITKVTTEGEQELPPGTVY